MGNYPFNKLWVWLLMIGIVIFIVSVVSFFIYSNSKRITQTPIWVVGLFFLSIIFIVLSIIISTFDYFKACKKKSACQKIQDCKNSLDESCDYSDTCEEPELIHEEINHCAVKPKELIIEKYDILTSEKQFQSQENVQTNMQNVFKF